MQLNGKGNEEVLCAIGELDGGTSTTAGLGAATITATDFVTTAFDVSDGGNIDVRVIFNEKVTVTGSPTLVITNSQGLVVLPQLRLQHITLVLEQTDLCLDVQLVPVVQLYL